MKLLPFGDGWLKAGSALKCSFVLKQKNQKFKAAASYATKYKLQLNDLNSLRSNSKSFLTLQLYILLNATKLKAWLHST